MTQLPPLQLWLVQLFWVLLLRQCLEPLLERPQAMWQRVLEPPPQTQPPVLLRAKTLTKLLKAVSLQVLPLEPLLLAWTIFLALGHLLLTAVPLLLHLLAPTLVLLRFMTLETRLVLQVLATLASSTLWQIPMLRLVLHRPLLLREQNFLL